MSRLGSTLVYRLPGPNTTRSARSRARTASGYPLARSGWMYTRTTSPPAAAMRDCPCTRRRAPGASPAQRTSAHRSMGSREEGRIRPRTARTRPASRRPLSKSPVMPVMAAMNRFPKEWPSRLVPRPKRYWNRFAMSGSASARAAMQSRRSPGGGRPSSCLRTPLDPPSSATVTIAVIWSV